MMSNYERIDNRMSNKIDDINYSRYKDAEVNKTEVIISDTEIAEDTSQTKKRPTRENAGKGIARLDPMFTGKSYDSIKKKLKLLMNKTKNEVKKKTTYDAESSMKYAINLMITQMWVTQIFDLFVESAVDDMIK